MLLWNCSPRFFLVCNGSIYSIDYSIPVALKDWWLIIIPAFWLFLPSESCSIRGLPLCRYGHNRFTSIEVTMRLAVVFFFRDVWVEMLEMAWDWKERKKSLGNTLVVRLFLPRYNQVTHSEGNKECKPMVFLMQDNNNASFGLVMTHDLSALLEQDRLLNMDYHCGGFYEEVWPVGRHKDEVYKYTNKSYRFEMEVDTFPGLHPFFLGLNLDIMLTLIWLLVSTTKRNIWLLLLTNIMTDLDKSECWSHNLFPGNPNLRSPKTFPQNNRVSFLNSTEKQKRPPV